jgi:hypothetical protein
VGCARDVGAPPRVVESSATGDVPCGEVIDQCGELIDLRSVNDDQCAARIDQCGALIDQFRPFVESGPGRSFLRRFHFRGSEPKKDAPKLQDGGARALIDQCRELIDQGGELIDQLAALIDVDRAQIDVDARRRKHGAASIAPCRQRYSPDCAACCSSIRRICMITPAALAAASPPLSRTAAAGTPGRRQMHPSLYSPIDTIPTNSSPHPLHFASQAAAPPWTWASP